MELKEVAERVEKWLKKGEKNFPYKIDFFLTERCNLKCIFCNYPKIGRDRIENELTEDELKKIVNFAGKNGTKIVGILGGEPFCRKDILLKIMKLVKGYGMEGSIVTNGTLIDEEDVKKIVEMEWDLIRFSIDGLEATHDFLRGKKGCFQKILRTIETFRKFKKIYKKSSPSIQINFVLNNRNYQELPAVVELAEKLGCDFVYVLPMLELTEECKPLKIRRDEEEDVRTYLETAAEIANELGIGTNAKDLIFERNVRAENVRENILKKGGIPCFLPWYTMNIDAVGNVTPCCNLSPFPHENLRERSLEEIWFGTYFEKMREAMKTGTLPNECSRCCMPLFDENETLRKLIDV